MADNEYRQLAELLRDHVPDDAVDLYESYLNEVEEKLGLEELFDALEAADARIPADAATLMWKLAYSWGITRFTEAEVNALVE